MNRKIVSVPPDVAELARDLQLMGLLGDTPFDDPRTPALTPGQKIKHYVGNALYLLNSLEDMGIQRQKEFIARAIDLLKELYESEGE